MVVAEARALEAVQAVVQAVVLVENVMMMTIEKKEIEVLVQVLAELVVMVVDGVDGTIYGLMMLGILLVMFMLAPSRRRKSRRDETAYKSKEYRPSQNELENQVKQFIPEFDRIQFLNEGYKIYCDIQEAWMNFKLEDVKDVLTDELYSMYESQLATLEVKGEQNIMKDFVLKKSFLKGVQNQNNTITITTGYVIEFYDYIANRNTGEVVRGTADRKIRVTYEMKFRQSLDENNKVEKCPNCGAPIRINAAGVCDFCRAKIVTENTKWVLTEKQSLGQNFVNQ